MSSVIEYSSQELRVLVRQVIEAFVLAQVREMLARQLRSQLDCPRVLDVPWSVDILNLPHKVVDGVLISREPLLQQILEVDLQFSYSRLAQAWDAELVYHTA